MSVAFLQAQVRDRVGKGGARELRRQGQVPAIIYGGKNKEVSVSINEKELVKEINKSGYNSRILEIKLANETVKVLPKAVDFHPVTDKPEHADFRRVDKGEKVKVFVKTDFKNIEKSPGIKRGGILNIVRREIELLCDIDYIPAAIEVNLEGTQIGHSIHINDIKLPQGVEATLRRNFTIATIGGRITEEQELAKDTARAAVIAANAAEQAAKDAAIEAKKNEEKKAKEDTKKK